jgi:hypothetical protein
VRRLLLLALAGLGAWWLLSRRRGPVREATVGFDDGSAVVLEEGSVDLEALVGPARDALRA